MLELLTGGVAGGLMGGLFRLAPEVLKWLDRKNLRKHELNMFKAQVELEVTRGQIKLEEIGATHQMNLDTGAIDALRESIRSQTEMAASAGGIAAMLSALVRPLITYWVWFLYSVAFTALLWVTWVKTSDPVQVANLVLTPDFMTLLSGITNFWFLDRVLKKRGL